MNELPKLGYSESTGLTTLQLSLTKEHWLHLLDALEWYRHDQEQLAEQQSGDSEIDEYHRDTAMEAKALFHAVKEQIHI